MNPVNPVNPMNPMNPMAPMNPASPLTTTTTKALLPAFSALVTGAASGIGLHTALALARHGATRLALADADADALAAAAAQLAQTWPLVDVLPLAVDVRRDDDVRAAVARAAARFGRLDVAVNGAGVAGRSACTHDLPEGDWQRVVDVNLDGVYRCQREELAAMVGQEDLGPRRGRGAIVNVASIYGLVGSLSGIHQSAYVAAKHAVVGLTRANANAYADDNIRINAVCPGFTLTPLAAAADSPPIREHLARTPMKRMATPDEIADAIVFLASPMGSFVTGAALAVGGGFTSS